MYACIIRELRNYFLSVVNMTDDIDDGPTGGTTSNDATLQSLLQILVNHTIQGPTTNNAYQIMPDLSQSIGNFNGESDIGGETEAWLNNLNTVTLHHWPKELMLQMARRHLIGPARDWLLSRFDSITTWAEFVTLFQKIFRTGTSYSKRFAQMQSRVHNKGETTSAYFHNKVRRCCTVNLEIEDTKEQVLLGLRSHELARSLLNTTIQMNY